MCFFFHVVVLLYHRMPRFGLAGYLVRISYDFCHRIFLCLYYFHAFIFCNSFPSVVFVRPVLIPLPLLSCFSFTVKHLQWVPLKRFCSCRWWERMWMCCRIMCRRRWRMTPDDGPQNNWYLRACTWTSQGHVCQLNALYNAHKCTHTYVPA